MVILGILLLIWAIINLKLVDVYHKSNSKNELWQLDMSMLLSMVLVVLFTWGLFFVELFENQPINTYITATGFVILGGSVQGLITTLMLRKAIKIRHS